MTVKLLTEQYLEYLSLKGGCTGSSQSTLVKMPHCWKSRVAAQLHYDGLIGKSHCSLYVFTINQENKQTNKSSAHSCWQNTIAVSIK